MDTDEDLNRQFKSARSQVVKDTTDHSSRSKPVYLTQGEWEAVIAMAADSSVKGEQSMRAVISILDQIRNQLSSDVINTRG